MPHVIKSLTIKAHIAQLNEQGEEQGDNQDFSTDVTVSMTADYGSECDLDAAKDYLDAIYTTAQKRKNILLG